MLSPAQVSFLSRGGILEGTCTRDKLPEIIPEIITVGGWSYLLVDDAGEADDLYSYVRTEDALNFDAIKAEGRGASPIAWQSGRGPIGEPENPQ